MITVSEMMRTVRALEEKNGERCSLLGIGPMSRTVIRAAFTLAKEKDFPLMFIASRNQVDARELGGGYVCGWDQKAFVEAIGQLAAETGFDGLYFICRDHGGPWQRDNEREAGLAAEEAMNLGKRSYLEDLLAGFHLLHIDPTKDPHLKGVIPMDLVLERTVALIEHVEGERRKRNLPPVAYEVGTEETSGGLTSEEAYASFIRKLTAVLSARDLPRPDFIVGQTGTLTRLTENVGRFDAATAARLSATARAFGLGLKEHNADYLSDFILCYHPALGITAANVAPEFGVVETDSYLLLARLEADAYEKGFIKTKSRFAEAIAGQAAQGGRWRKWMVGAEKDLSPEEVVKDARLADLVTRVSGHYHFEHEEIKAALSVLYRNLESLGIKPQDVVQNRIKQSIGRYVECFNLAGLTGRITGAAVPSAVNYS